MCEAQSQFLLHTSINFLDYPIQSIATSSLTISGAPTDRLSVPPICEPPSSSPNQQNGQKNHDDPLKKHVDPPPYGKPNLLFKQLPQLRSQMPLLSLKSISQRHPSKSQTSKSLSPLSKIRSPRSSPSSQRSLASILTALRTRRYLRTSASIL